MHVLAYGAVDVMIDRLHVVPRNRIKGDKKELEYVCGGGFHTGGTLRVHGS